VSFIDRFRSEAQAEGQRLERREARWPASLALLGVIALYLFLPLNLTIGPRWVVPTLELGLLIPLTLGSPYRHGSEPRIARMASIFLTALVSAANFVTLALLLRYMLQGGKATGVQLAFSAIMIWTTNVVAFGLWYWEFDAGGPAERMTTYPKGTDFLFPQLTAHDIGAGWGPSFFDYFYVSFTNSTAFSPTDTMPLSVWAKILMTLQAVVALTTVVLVAARAVNILS
jgi:hypothetical protein